jgi:hypothetical protein
VVGVDIAWDCERCVRLGGGDRTACVDAGVERPWE